MRISRLAIQAHVDADNTCHHLFFPLQLQANVYGSYMRWSCYTPSCWLARRMIISVVSMPGVDSNSGIHAACTSVMLFFCTACSTTTNFSNIFVPDAGINPKRASDLDENIFYKASQWALISFAVLFVILHQHLPRKQATGGHRFLSCYCIPLPFL